MESWAAEFFTPGDQTAHIADIERGQESCTGGLKKKDDGCGAKLHEPLSGSGYLDNHSRKACELHGVEGGVG